MMGNARGNYEELQARLMKHRSELLEPLRDKVTLLRDLKGGRDALIFDTRSQRDIFQRHMRAAFPEIITEAHPVRDERSALLLDSVYAEELFVRHIPQDRQISAQGITLREWEHPADAALPETARDGRC